MLAGYWLDNSLEYKKAPSDKDLWGEEEQEK